MTHLTKTLAFLFLVAITGPALAQATGDATTGDDTTAEAPAEAADGPGSIYIAGEHGDWQNRCIRGAIGQPDICQMFYLITDENGTPVSEFTILKVLGQEDVAATATILTPLDVLLPPGIEIQVDGKPAGRVPFIACTPQNCASEFTLKPGDVEVFKKGLAATLTITALRAPPQPVPLTVSLKGFTAAFNELKAPGEATQ